MPAPTDWTVHRGGEGGEGSRRGRGCRPRPTGPLQQRARWLQRKVRSRATGGAHELVASPRPPQRLATHTLNFPQRRIPLQQFRKTKCGAFGVDVDQKSFSGQAAAAHKLAICQRQMALWTANAAINEIVAAARGGVAAMPIPVEESAFAGSAAPTSGPLDLASPARSTILQRRPPKPWFRREVKGSAAIARPSRWLALS